MEVVLSEEARDYVAIHGGVVHVRPEAHRCCTGPITLLHTSTEAPEDADVGVAVPAGGVTLRYHGDASSGPGLLTVELRGRLRRRLVASWDGCAYKL
ncbi:MAG TPA: hypothetical protein VEG62_01725 [Acidimicrobiales bacterium]|nr:hypothetical protein [Acidimicrobiales bacterium]